jgi:hypothetical protein
VLGSHASSDEKQVPICEIDPWRTQYFERVACPADVLIPTEDSDAWLWNPRHRWIYDKLAIALSQNLAAAPHGVAPPSYPVFSKPIYNLKGMGVGSRRLDSQQDYAAAYQPVHFWSTLLEGDHVSIYLAVVDGVPHWWRHARGLASGEGTFDYWQVEAEPDPAVEGWCDAWCRKYLGGYTGMVNLETIGGRIIEVHLRFADQWPASTEVIPGRGAGPPLPRPKGPTTIPRPHRLQHRAVRAARTNTAIRQPAATRDCRYGRHLEPADYVSRGLGSRPSCHAARRLPGGDRQLLGPRDGAQPASGTFPFAAPPNTPDGDGDLTLHAALVALGATPRPYDRQASCSRRRSPPRHSSPACSRDDGAASRSAQMQYARCGT